MKKIKGIEERVDDINQDRLTDDQKKSLPSFKEMFVAVCGLTTTQDPAQAISYFDIGKKIKDAKADVVLENSEMDLLKSAVEKNPTKLPVIYFAQMIKKIRSAEELKPEVI